MYHHFKSNYFAGLAAILAAFGATSVNAQSSNETDSSVALEEVTVYARKRAESMQDVPIAITAFGLAEIEAAGIRDVVDVAALTPGFNIATLFSGDGSTPVIRGMSTTIGEPNVGFFVDGIYMGSRQTMTAILGNFVQSIEIAKGPQSALYGRNTFGGAVNYVTRQPSEDFEGEAEVQYGSDGRQVVRAMFGGPFGDSNFSYRLGAMYDSFDGFYTNELTGGSLDARETKGALGSILWQGENADVTFNVVIDQTDNGDSPLQWVENNNYFGSAFGLPPDFQLFTGQLPDITDGYANTPGGLERDQVFSSLNINWELGNMIFTSITGYNDFDHTRAIDDDYEARDIHFVTTTSSVTELSQEFRLTSDSDGPFTWMAGIYGYSREETIVGDSRYQGFLFGIFGGGLNNNQLDTDNIAAFGSFGWDITDALTITLSGRYGQEDKSVDVTDTPLVPPGSAGVNYKDNDSWTAFLPRLDVAWRLNDDHMAYFSYAQSAKSGGFNTVTVGGAIAPDERTYEPENSDNYEIGLKSTFSDGRLATNIAAYYVNWTDQIVRALGATGVVLNENAGETTSKGIEAELLGQLTDKLNVRLGVAYNDIKYDEYIFGALAGLGIDPDLAGKTLQYSPEWTANISVGYVQPVGAEWEWFTRLDYDYQDEMTAVQTADAFTGSSDRLNINTGFGNDNWRITLWAYNLLENETATSGVYLPNPSMAPDVFVFGSRPGFQVFQGLVTGPQLRSYGLTLKYDF